MKSKQEKSIDELVADAIQYITRQCYSEVSIYFYSRIWRKLTKYAHENQAKYYSTELRDAFFYELTGITLDTRLDKYNIQKIRALKILDDLSMGSEIKNKYILEKPFVPKPFKKILETYRKNLSDKGQKEITIETKISRILVFLRYLDSQCIRLSNVTFQVIANFYLFLSSEYAPNPDKPEPKRFKTIKPSYII